MLMYKKRKGRNDRMINMKKLALKITGGIVAFAPAIALGQTAPPNALPSGPGDVITILTTITGWMFAIFLALAVVIFLYAAFLYLTAAGNAENVTKAKSALIYGVVAIVVAVIASGIAPVVCGLLNVTC